MGGGQFTAPWLLALSMLAACAPESPPAPVQLAATCPADGALVASVFGSLEGRLEWRGVELECEGMPRPHGQGARLRFAGPALAGSEAERLAFIIAMPKLEKGQAGSELEAGVTLMLEDTGRFYSSPEQAGCWADIDVHEPAAGSAGSGDSDEYRISGILYCLSPLAELNGTASVSILDLEFSGRLDWTDPP
jgi:hypothetical protein